MLKNNPFHILNVPMSASRREISEKAEEQSLLFDSDVCNEAQAVLTNPAKRVIAEIGWFPGESEETIASIRASIDSDQDIDSESLDIIGKLNVLLDSFSRHDMSEDQLVESINSIDVYFDILDADILLDDINEERLKAGIAETDINSVESGLQKKRESIRTTITEKLDKYNDQEYLNIISKIANSCLVSSDMSHGVIVDDVIHQYELRMQPQIESKTEQLREYMEAIKSQVSASYRSTQVDSFINLLKLWDNYVQPIQLLSQSEGSTHIISRNIAIEARDLAITLHNDYHDIINSQKIINALTEVFAELPELITVLNSDKNTLEANRVASNSYGGVNGSTSQSQSSSGFGEALTTLLALALRFWWVILLAVILLSDCEGDTGTSGTSYDSDTDTYTEENYDPYEGLEEQPMPENEYKFVNVFGDDRPSQIVVENPTDSAYVMKFEDEAGETVFSFFVQPQSTAPMYMGTGTYYLKWASGKTWYGEEDLFGPDTVYQKDDEAWTFEAGYGWTLTMQSVVNGNVHSDTIDADEF